MSTAAQQSDTPTRWDLSNIYSGLEGEDYIAAVDEATKDLAGLESYFDTHGIRRLAKAPATADDTLVGQVDELINRASDLVQRFSTLRAFVFAGFAADSTDATAAREVSRLDQLGVRFSQLSVRLEGWIGSLEPVVDELVGRSEQAKDHAFFLRWTAKQSRYLMDEGLEALAAELVVDGGSAFGKLQGTVTSQLTVEFDAGDGKKEIPITVLQNYRTHSDGALRKRAHETANTAWKSIAPTVAAALNSVKGTALTLAKRRGRDDVLDEALDQNRIDRGTLDAMMGAIRECFPVFRRYLAAKARKLRKNRLAWWDIAAPVGKDAMRFSWTEARDFIVERFSTFTPELGTFAARAFDQRWIDGAPRKGKRGGAFCMPIIGVDESRILANFDGSFDELSTLAHELGHAWHNECQKGLPALLRGAPSTLAETASIFCETLVAEAALVDAEPDGQLQILEAQLLGACSVCLDISSRFIFERSVFEQRGRAELSADELCKLMTDAQTGTYGDSIDPASYARYAWLNKPHYYAHNHNYYNFPYAFGHLFGLGLYAIYREQGEAFVPRYTELLRHTGQELAAPLAARFDIDITSAGFWRDSLKVIEAQVDRYEQL